MGKLQRGFTEHASSKFTAFIASETILIYKKFNQDLELLTVDAEKAFDTVNHDIMLNKITEITTQTKTKRIISE
jgi:hypothetical protein